MIPNFMGIMATGLMALSLFVSPAQAAWDLTKKNNMMLYWGQNAHGQAKPTDTANFQKRLIEYCKDPNVDLISVGFLNSFTSADGQPVVNFSNQCGGTFPGSSLLWCPLISEDIIACQKLGKKILLSIGGGYGDYDGFATMLEAQQFGLKLWNMFGKGWTYYRPFGEAVVDGFDFDLEKNKNTNYHALAQKLRQLMDADSKLSTGKKWLLTAAPQCPSPDKVLDQALTNQMFDAIFIQFYNNPCSANKWTAAGKQDNVDTFNYGMWHAWIAKSAKNKNLKMFLTLPASGNVAGSGYVSKDTAAKIVADLAKKYPTSFAGVGFWDASEASVNVGYTARVKSALNTAQSATVKKRGLGFAHSHGHRHASLGQRS